MLRRTSQTEMAGRAPPCLVAVAVPPPCPSPAPQGRERVHKQWRRWQLRLESASPPLRSGGGTGWGPVSSPPTSPLVQLHNPFPIERQLLPRSKARREPHQRLDQHQLVDDHRRLCSKCQLAEEGDAHARGRQATGYGKRCSGRCPWPVAREPSKIQLHRQLPPRSGHHGDQLSVGVA